MCFGSKFPFFAGLGRGVGAAVAVFTGAIAAGCFLSATPCQPVLFVLPLKLSLQSTVARFAESSVEFHRSSEGSEQILLKVRAIGKLLALNRRRRKRAHQCQGPLVALENLLDILTA